MTCKRFFFTINLQISDAPLGEMTQSYCCLTPRSNFLYHDVQLGVYLWLPTLLQCPWSQVSSVSLSSLLWFYHPPPSQTATARRTESSSSARLVKRRPVPAFCCATTCFLAKNNSRFPKYHKCGCVAHRSHKNAERRRPGTCCQTSQQQYHLSPNYTITSK